MWQKHNLTCVSALDTRLPRTSQHRDICKELVSTPNTRRRKRRINACGQLTPDLGKDNKGEHSKINTSGKEPCKCFYQSWGLWSRPRSPAQQGLESDLPAPDTVQPQTDEEEESKGKEKRKARESDHADTRPASSSLSESSALPSAQALLAQAQTKTSSQGQRVQWQQM